MPAIADDQAPLGQAAARRRQAILDAALELFAERGFHGTAVPAIAELAGVGTGTVYRNFESKEVLVNELYRLWKRRYAEFALAGWPREGSGRDRFSAIWALSVEFSRLHGRALSFVELYHHTDYLDERSVELGAAMHGRFEALVGAMQRDRLVRADVEPGVIITVVEGVFLRLYRDHGGVPEPTILAQAERCTWDSIRA